MSSVSTPDKNAFLPEPLRVFAPYGLLALIVFAVYGNIYDNSFLFDDDLLIKINSFLPDWSHVFDLLTHSTTGGSHIAGGFYRPMQMLLYLLAFHLGDGGEFWFHLLNVSLHVANTCFVYRLGTKLGFHPGGVFLAALIWGIHPLHTEAVTYISGTADPLFAFFTLWAISHLVPDITPPKILTVFPLFLLALLSKETAVMFPLLVMSCIFFTSPRRLDLRSYLCTWSLWIVTGLYVFWRSHAQGFDGPQSYAHFYALPEYSNLKIYADHPLDRVYTFLATLPSYFKLLIWPEGLHMERNFSVFTTPWAAPVMMGFGLCCLALGQIVRSARAPHLGLALGWGCLWFAAAHAPDTGILIPMNSLFLEHWMYLPSAGLFLGLAETGAGFLRHKPKALVFASIAATLVFAGILSVKTYEQNQVWLNPVSFYTNIFSRGVTSARAHNNLALYYSDQGQYTAAIEQFKEAIATGDTYAETHHNLALTYLNMPDQRAHIPEVIEHLNRAIEIDPRFYRSYQLLGDVYIRLLNDPEKAEFYHQKAADIAGQGR